MAISLYSMLGARFSAVRVSLATRPLLAVAPSVRFASGSSSEASPDELQAARKWLAQLHAETIPKSIGELSFSRSSGPGGQNVNKYASAASMSMCGSALR
jgi:peptidyl-tRNA hydrolase ICT1